MADYVRAAYPDLSDRWLMHENGPSELGQRGHAGGALGGEQLQYYQHPGAYAANQQAPGQSYGGTLYPSDPGLTTGAEAAYAPPFYQEQPQAGQQQPFFQYESANLQADGNTTGSYVQHYHQPESRVEGYGNVQQGSYVDRNQDVDSSRSRDRDRDRSRDRDRDRDRERYRHERERERDGGRDRERSARHRSPSPRRRSRSRERARGREDNRERGLDRRPDGERERRGDREYDREHERDRQRYDDRYSTRGRSRSSADGYDSDQRHRCGHGEQPSPSRTSRRYSPDTHAERYGTSRSGRPLGVSGSTSSGHGRSRYAQQLEAGLDGGDGSGRGTSAERVLSGAGGAGGREQPSHVVFVRGIPEDKDESDMWKLLEALPKITAIRLVRDKYTGQSRGYAFIEFASEADAAVLMETSARYSTVFEPSDPSDPDARPRPLRFEYTQPQAALVAASAGGGIGGNGGGGVGGASLDWLCDRCNAVNFARRLECYQCSSARPANPTRVASEGDGPSPVLRVSGLEPHASEEALTQVFEPFGALKEIRMVRDKFTGMPRGFAFVEFVTAASAAKALLALNNTSPVQLQLGGQAAAPLRISYARDRVVSSAPGGGGGGGGIASDAVEAAQAMQMYSGWEPKAFDDKAIDIQQGQDQQQQQKQAADSNGDGGLSAGDGGHHGAATSGFVYDVATGYWHDPSTGYYYDANTGLYYHPSAGQWYQYDASTGNYTAVGTGDGSGAGTTAAAANTAAVSHADPPLAGPIGPSLPAVSSVAVASAGGSASASAAAGAAAGPVGASKPKRSAVIGAAPVYNPEGVLVAAALSEEKERARLRAAQQAARRAGGKAAAAGGVASGPKPAATASTPTAASPAAHAPSATHAQQPQAPGQQVAGVIHRSGKWRSAAAAN